MRSTCPFVHPSLMAVVLGMLGILGVLVAGCAAPHGASDDAPSAATPNDAGDRSNSLEGTSWVLAALPSTPALTGQPATAHFESGQVRGGDGCNRYSAPFTVAGDALTVGSNGAMTKMACPPEVMAQAQAFHQALENARRYRIVDDRLELLSPDGTTLAVMAAQSMTVVGHWEVTAINNGREAVVGVLEHAPSSMMFASDGTVTGSTGCNRFNATFTAERHSFRFGPVTATERGCGGDGVMEQEQAFLRALATVAAMRVEGDRLEFRTADDALALMLSRARDR